MYPSESDKAYRSASLRDVGMGCPRLSSSTMAARSASAVLVKRIGGVRAMSYMVADVGHAYPPRKRSRPELGLDCNPSYIISALFPLSTHVVTNRYRLPLSMGVIGGRSGRVITIFSVGDASKLPRPPMFRLRRLRGGSAGVAC